MFTGAFCEYDFYENVVVFDILTGFLRKFLQEATVSLN